METQMIPLAKISPSAIKAIRSVKPESKSFQDLETIINSDSQKYPIVIRKLINEDFDVMVLPPTAEYGIIDGQHRFEIAQKNGKTEILANIISDNIPEDPVERKIFDTRMALHMNSGIPMTVLQKGRVILDLSENTGRSVTDIGYELFGVGTAMAYRYVQAYKEHQNMARIKKTREKNINSTQLADLSSAWEQIPHSEDEIDFNDISKCIDQIEKIKALENKLSAIRRIYLSQEAIKTEVKRRKEEPPETTSPTNE